MKKRPDPPISNLALGGVAFLFVLTVGVLGGLYFNLRPRPAAQASKAVAPLAPRSVEAAAKIPDEPMPPAVAADDAPVIRIALRAPEAPVAVAELPVASAVAAEPAAPVQVAVETPAATQAPAAVEKEFKPLEPPSRAALSAGSPAMPAKKDANDEMVPDINGISYTARKAAANGGNAYAGNKPGEAKPGKKADLKKPVPPPVSLVPQKPPMPSDASKMVAAAKAETAKPALPALDPTQIDFSKAPIYVLNDGRRIRAVLVKDNGVMISVKNETGTEVIFKKTDVKEILRG